MEARVLCQNRLDLASAMDRMPIPVQNDGAADCSQQATEKDDHLLAAETDLGPAWADPGPSHESRAQ